MSNNPQHKIVALLAASYSGNASTAEHRNYFAGVIAARIEKHDGAIFESSGGEAVAEFEETADAVNCAIDIQSKLAEYNKIHPDAGQAEVRLGVHYGELFSSENKIIGSGIEVARGLLAIVPPSKIYITREGFRRVRSVLQLKTETLGMRSLLHNAELVEIFSVLWESVQADMETSLKRLERDDFHRTAITGAPAEPHSPRRKKLPMMIFVIIVVAFLVLRYFHVL
ncbi:MAG: hypothetical protein KGJ59_10195 [Bacteroidota bacterium]|nr:hypothetical protein [Bacteroidota bacterium]